MIRTLRAGPFADGDAVPVPGLYTWFWVPRRTVCWRPTKASPKPGDRFVAPIRPMNRENPPFWPSHSRVLAGLLQKHGATGLPDQRLASVRTANRSPTAD